MPDVTIVDKSETTAEIELAVKVTVEWVQDEDPNLSYLGEYSNTPKENAVDRHKRCDLWEDGMRFWNPANDDDVLTAYKRHEAYERGDWHMRGCLVTVKHGALMAEGNLFQVESDCTPEHKLEIQEEAISCALEDLQVLIDERLNVA